MPHSDIDRAIALAAVHQAAHCVQRIATRGSVDVDALTPCIHSLFQIDADDVPAVFGPPGAVATGARQLIAQLTGEPDRNLELMRAVVALLRHERLLSERPDLLAAIGNGIREADAARDGLPLIDRSVIAALAALYAATVSQLTPRIVVRGDPQHLRNMENQERVRALLLAGIRAAMLWRQIGGRRIQVLFGRRRLLESARAYLRAAT